MPIPLYRSIVAGGPIPQIYGAAAALAPNQISNLQFWVKSDTEVYQDAALIIPATLDLALVGGWKDQSGNANHITNLPYPTAFDRYDLNVQNSLPGIFFDSGPLMGSLTQSSGQAYTVYLAIDKGPNDITACWNGAGSNEGVIYRSGLTSTDCVADGAAGLSTVSMASGINFLVVIFNTVSGLLQVGSTSVSGNAGDNATTGLSMGGDYSGTFWNEHIFEGAVWNKALSATEIAGLKQYFSSRYGV